MKESMAFALLLPKFKKCGVYLDEMLHRSSAFLLLKSIGKLLLSMRARRCYRKGFIAFGLKQLQARGQI